MAEAVVRRSAAIAAVPGQVRVARGFARVLGQGHPLAEVAGLLASEVVSNSVRHGGPAAGGGVVTVTVTVATGSVRVQVAERSGDTSPVLRPAADPEDLEEGGRGLRLVDALATRWGYERGGGRASTWFEVSLG